MIVDSLMFRQLLNLIGLGYLWVALAQPRYTVHLNSNSNSNRKQQKPNLNSPQTSKRGNESNSKLWNISVTLPNVNLPWFGNKGDKKKKQQVQCQAQISRTHQAKATAQKQTLIQQIDDTFRTVVMAAQMALDAKYNDHAVNSMTDAAIMTLNMITVSCAEFHKEGKQDALDLAKKMTHDKWEQLKQEDGKKTYDMTLKYRNFILAALNGEKNLRYKKSRVTEQKLFKQAPQEISKTFGRVIHQQQNFEAQQHSYLDPAVNQELGERHGADLAQFRTSSKYQEAKNIPKYQRPLQEQLYFTPSGRNAQFVNESAEEEKKQMDDELNGVVTAYEAIKDKIVYQNSVYTNTDGSSWPCVILDPGESQSAHAYDRTHIQVRPAYPKEDQILYKLPGSLEFNVATIKSCERMHAQKYATNNLGYRSIEEQESDMDLDQ